MGVGCWYKEGKGKVLFCMEGMKEGRREPTNLLTAMNSTSSLRCRSGLIDGHHREENVRGITDFYSLSEWDGQITPNASPRSLVAHPPLGLSFKSIFIRSHPMILQTFKRKKKKLRRERF